LKKITKEGVPFTGDFRETFPEYYNKCFIPIKKKANSDFVFFKNYTDDGKGDDEESEDSLSDNEENEGCNCKDLLLKEIELMFENGYSYTDSAKLFPTFYEVNIARINLLYIQVLQERYNRDPTLTVEKDTDIYKSNLNQIEIIEKRKTLKKAIKRTERNKEDEEDEEDEDTHSYKQYKAKKDFESVLHNEVQKAIKRKSERDEPSETTEEEEDEDTEEIIRELEKIDLEDSLETPMMIVKQKNQNQVSSSSPPPAAPAPHQQPQSSLTLQQPHPRPKICKTSQDHP
jgi:hypothetical protein